MTLQIHINYLRILSLRGGDESTCINPNFYTAKSPTASWSSEQDQRLQQLQTQLGNKWTEISRKLGGSRSPIEIRQRHAFLRHQAKISDFERHRQLGSPLAAPTHTTRKRHPTQAALGNKANSNDITPTPAKRARNSGSLSPATSPQRGEDYHEGGAEAANRSTLSRPEQMGATWTRARGWESRGESKGTILRRYWGIKKRAGKRGVHYALDMVDRFHAGRNGYAATATGCAGTLSPSLCPSLLKLPPALTALYRGGDDRAVYRVGISGRSF